MSKIVTLVAIAAITLAPGKSIPPGGTFSTDADEADRLKALGAARDPEVEVSEAPDKKLKAERTRADDAEAKVTFLQGEMADLQTENAELSRKLSAEQASRTAAESRASSAESSLAAEQTKSAGLQASLDAARAELADLKKKPQS